MTDDQVNLVVQHLASRLHLATPTEGQPRHIQLQTPKILDCDPASVRTVFSDRLALRARCSRSTTEVQPGLAEELARGS